jgi:cysteine desulfuration protein SufE
MLLACYPDSEDSTRFGEDNDARASCEAHDKLVNVKRFMSDNQLALPARLQDIIADFSEAEGREKLELLLEYSEQLPDLPERLRGKRDQMDQVHECMSPVYVLAEVEDGKVTFHFDIPPEAPTVRGYASLLASGLNGEPVADVIRVPDDFFVQMGLHKVISGQRLNGISALLAYMKRLAVRASAE